MNQASNSADVIIIGGGVIGLAVARELALRGVPDVLLIERNSLGGESSRAAAGMLAPQAEANRAHEFFDLTCRSRDMYPAFAAALLAETGVDIELDTTGTLYLAFTDDDEAELERRYKWQSQAELPVEKLSATSVRQLEPAINKGVRAALKFPLDIQVENRRLLKALIAANEKLRVRLETGTTVNALRVERDCVSGVETSRGFIATNSVVIAGGAWSSMLSAGDKALPDLRIKPVRGQMLCFEPNPALARHVIYSPRGYLVPRRDGRMLAGSTTEHAGFDKKVTTEGVHSIMTAAVEISPQVASLPLTDSWAGLRPRAADTLPVLGPCAEIAGVYYATGHYRNGILLAPVTGELIARAIVDRVFPESLGIFSPDRFGLVAVG
ncbi:MAG TPA: glycine oxidase ThiO [Pyrinomonadaceae bacterium]|nr:glycine oxidase ThiO [Pyrinomonadaceae bacterium]